MANRYTRSKIIENDSEFYEFLREKRGNLKSISHLSTVIMKQPSMLERASLKTTAHVWKYGDRYYNLAYKYYDDPEYWWVIAWYNGKPTEASLNRGDVITIPLSLEEALLALGVY
tara:strand:- start:224 stop:568 length:345 start_codon:yes stop_codon:yes gene_type:complete